MLLNQNRPLGQTREEKNMKYRGNISAVGSSRMNSAAIMGLEEIMDFLKSEEKGINVDSTPTINFEETFDDTSINSNTDKDPKSYTDDKPLLKAKSLECLKIKWSFLNSETASESFNEDEAYINQNSSNRDLQSSKLSKQFFLLYRLTSTTF